MRIQNNRRVLSSILLFALVVSLVSSLALAAGPNTQPDFIGLFVGTCGFNIGTLGLSNAAGTADLKYGYTATATLSIMQSPNGTSWSLYKQWSSAESSAIDMDKYWAVLPGYFYKAVMAITVYDSDHNVVEYVEIESPIQYY